MKNGRDCRRFLRLVACFNGKNVEDHNDDLITDYRVNDNVLNPMAAVRYHYSDEGTVYAGVAQKSRFATQKSRFGTRTGNGTGIPNPDLKAEKPLIMKSACPTRSAM